MAPATPDPETGAGQPYLTARGEILVRYGCAMSATESARTSWTDLPDEIRAFIAQLLDGPVVEAVSQSAGFSPGSADRVCTADGRRAFVKAVQRAPHPGTYDLHLRELEVMQMMPSGISAPSLIGSFVSPDWIALILEDVDGKHPGSALDGGDVVAVLDALMTLPVLAEDTALPRAVDELAVDASGWAELQDEAAVGDLPEWVQASFVRLRQSAEAVSTTAAGDHLLHLDCRADNLLIDAEGAAWIIDWPWAGIGARWVDGLCYLLDARLRGEAVDAEGHLARHPLFDGVASASIDSVLAALTGGFFAKARRPVPASMPALRDFQRGEALAGVAWLRERWG